MMNLSGFKKQEDSTLDGTPVSRNKSSKVFKVSYLAEIDSPPSESKEMNKAKTKVKHSQVFRNLLDFAREDSTDDTPSDLCDITFSENASCHFSTVESEKSEILTKRSEAKAEGYKSRIKKCLIKQSTATESERPNLFADQIDPLSMLYLSDSESSEAKSKSRPLNGLPYNHLVFSPKSSLSQQEFLRHLTKIKKGVTYSTNSLKEPILSYIESKKDELIDFPAPIPGKKKTLVLDLDGTLIWGCASKDDPTAIPIEYSDEQGVKYQIHLKTRPYLQAFLECLSSMYELIIFTAAAEFYAKAVIKTIDPESKYISYVLTRENCMQTKNGFFIKDLRILDRDLKNVIIIDDLVHSFGFQLDNGIPITEFRGDSSDDELIYIGKYLHKLAAVADIREANKSYLKLRDLLSTEISDAI